MSTRTEQAGSSPQRPRVLEIRHAESEPPGAYGPALDDTAETTTLRIWRDSASIDLTDFDAIVVLGGAMGVGDADRIPWIGDELDLLRRASDRGMPIWGVCLGAQMLAAALGGEVYTSDTPELGVHRVSLTDAGMADPVWGGAATAPTPREIDTVQWHFDTVVLPPGATLLASSESCVNQLFRVDNCYGVQFHLEAGGDLVTDWLSHPDSRSAVAGVLGESATDRFPGDAAAAEGITAPMADAVMRRWLREVVGHGRSRW
ncbi:type 1 glutamine amidotransferase [Gordonia sp. KTR9]|uniref:type 1 glutamine amidotransferase n=1 Tax=Gordonia sp. KTR9 TaxID=337191 RepID=UPI00027DDDDA|nr:type 1 glutamine amidotransferase [Gordonia sp. KTR9]AFR48342.1 GMP synthase - Glutamine amidotransferase domain protein [Gordonia sp. KTR9]